MHWLKAVLVGVIAVVLVAISLMFVSQKSKAEWNVNTPPPADVRYGLETVNSNGDIFGFICTHNPDILDSDKRLRMFITPKTPLDIQSRVYVESYPSEVPNSNLSSIWELSSSKEFIYRDFFYGTGDAGDSVYIYSLNEGIDFLNKTSFIIFKIKYVSGNDELIRFDTVVPKNIMRRFAIGCIYRGNGNGRNGGGGRFALDNAVLDNDEPRVRLLLTRTSRKVACSKNEYGRTAYETAKILQYHDVVRAFVDARSYGIYCDQSSQ